MADPGMMSSNRAPSSYYDILQVPTCATTSEIRQAYLRLIKLSHPDKVRMCATVDINYSAPTIIEAHAVLSDQIKRMAYDTEIRSGTKMTAGPSQCEPRFSLP